MEMFGRQRAAAQRLAERRQREDEAPRLSSEVPELAELRLEVEERSTSILVSQPKYVRRFVVASAPALFLLPCGDPSCRDGGHDVTTAVMNALRARKTAIVGDDVCYGELGSATCARVLHFQAIAEYRMS